MDQPFHIGDFVVPTEGPERRRFARIIRIRSHPEREGYLYQLAYDGERLPYEYTASQLLEVGQAFAGAGVALSVQVAESEVRDLLAEWFPNVERLLTLDEALDRETYWRPIIFDVSATGAPDFPCSVDFSIFPARNGDDESTEISIALARRFHRKFNCRALCVAGRFSDYGEEYPYHSIIWEDGQAFLADDDGTTLCDGSGGPVRIVRPLDVPLFELDEWGLLVDGTCESTSG